MDGIRNYSVPEAIELKVSELSQPFSTAGIEQGSDGRWHGYFWYARRPSGEERCGGYLTRPYDTVPEALEALERGERAAEAVQQRLIDDGYRLGDANRPS